MAVDRSLLYPTFRCGDCGCEVGFRSRRRTLTERFILPLFLLKPVRCGECFRRYWRFMFVPVKNRLSEASGLHPLAKPPATDKTDNRNVA
jgi:hypothetical protein